MKSSSMLTTSTSLSAKCLHACACQSESLALTRMLMCGCIRERGRAYEPELSRVNSMKNQQKHIKFIDGLFFGKRLPYWP